uniref:Uncharacterized protein n=1 Tax=Vitis vinifera TaxID=29760 RepID=F6HPU9_VITVI
MRKVEVSIPPHPFGVFISVLGIFFFREASSLKQILKRSRGGLNPSAHILDANSCHFLMEEIRIKGRQRRI